MSAAIIANNLFGSTALSAAMWSSMSKLWDNLRLFQILAGLSALILTVGVLIEYGVQLKQLGKLYWKWVRRKATPFDNCVLRKMSVQLLGPILVVIGVAGDVIFEIRLFIIEDH
jgi:hypothetical protein